MSEALVAVEPDDVVLSTELTRLNNRPPTERESASSSSASTTCPSVVGSLRGSVSSSGHSMVKPGGVGSGVAGSPPGSASTGSGMDTAASRAWPPKSG